MVESADLAEANRMLRNGNEVGQMMKVVGEEGTSIDDFIVYLKSEYMDATYLQQNAFDEIDSLIPSNASGMSFRCCLNCYAVRFASLRKQKRALLSTANSASA